MREFGFRNSENFWLWNQESSKYLLRNPDILENFCFGIRNPGKFLNPESGNFCDFGLRNTAQRIRNPTNDSNPESASSIDKVFGRNPVPGIRNPWPGIQNPRLSRILLHGARAQLIQGIELRSTWSTAVAPHLKPFCCHLAVAGTINALFNTSELSLRCFLSILTLTRWNFCNENF